MVSWYFKKVVKLAWYTHDHVRTHGTHNNIVYDFMVLVVNVLGLPSIIFWQNLPNSIILEKF